MNNSSKMWWLETTNVHGQRMLLCCHSLGNAVYNGKEGDSISRDSQMLEATHIIYNGKAKKVRS
jgi:hypothetical protein